tara:strand:- start:9844 stop:10404 length:561 start_codon:yes stop_codon:yes gene_type:complete
MDSLTVEFSLLKKHNISLNEYLALYNLVCPGCIGHIFTHRSSDVAGLEKKGFIKLTSEGIILREKANLMFHVGEDYFLKWLNTYPMKVNKSTGGSRVLSPKSDETTEGRKLRKNWKTRFKGAPEKEILAIKVLEAEVAMRIKANDLEFMVEAARWLNGGYYEKYEYLLEEKTDVINGVVDYSEDWK